jgi:hypothetical protein
MRPSFQDIMTTLRTLSNKNPIGSEGTHSAPTGLVYLVNTVREKRRRKRKRKREGKDNNIFAGHCWGTSFMGKPSSTNVTSCQYVYHFSFLPPSSLLPHSPNHAELHNALLREKARNYRGYEARYDPNTNAFLFVFTRVEDAMNFCIETQLELKHIAWPDRLLREPGYENKRE